MIAYQYDHAGVYLGETEADPSPLEPGKYLLPARCTTTPPPTDISEGEVARWNGGAWGIVSAPAIARSSSDPVSKLREFLNENPDVAYLLTE